MSQIPQKHEFIIITEKREYECSIHLHYHVKMNIDFDGCDGGWYTLGSLRVFVKGKLHDEGGYGPYSNDPLFESEVNKKLCEILFHKDECVDLISYSEAGRQGNNFVDFDMTQIFCLKLIECNLADEID